MMLKASLLLLLGVAALASAESLQPTDMQSWLAKAPAGVQYYTDKYGSCSKKAETSTTCLKLRTIENCDIIGLLSAVYYETQLECCGASDAPSDMMDAPFNSIGKCSWRLDPFALALIKVVLDASTDNLEGTTQLGLFSVTCEFNANSEQCGEGPCEDLILEGKGTLSLVADAAIMGLPSLEGTGICGTNFNSPFRQMRESSMSLPQGYDLSFLLPRDPGATVGGGNIRKSSEGRLQYAKSSTKHGNAAFDPTALYYNGTALMAHGHVSVKGRHGHVKYDEGAIQANLVYIVGSSDPEPGTPTANQFIVDPYRINLKLKKGDNYDY